MPVLAIDTSAAVAVALTSDDGVTLAAGRITQDRRHAELLAPMITGVLSEGGVERRAVTTIVAGTGPAPFTGLRVGLVTARSLALALDVPVLGVCSLDAIAAQAADDLGPAAGAHVLVATDARRREVYWARYRVVVDTRIGDRVQVVSGPAVVRPAELAGVVAPGDVVVGRGAVLYPDLLRAVPGAPLDPDPAVLARIALARRARGLSQPSEPLYLRRPDVMEPGPRKRALG